MSLTTVLDGFLKGSVAVRCFLKACDINDQIKMNNNDLLAPTKIVFYLAVFTFFTIDVTTDLLVLARKQFSSG